MKRIGNGTWRRDEVLTTKETAGKSKEMLEESRSKEERQIQRKTETEEG
jgi:hypothetical protein